MSVDFEPAIAAASTAQLGSALTELGGYDILEPLAEDATFLAVAPGGRRVVLKTLEPDLIARGQLHPSVRDRLGRVREIAHLGVANLHGVERDAGRVYAIWEFVEGVPLENWCVTSRPSPREVLLLARELVLAVEALHARGVVHGAIHARNIIVDSSNRLKLTHISPYLYTDPAVDTLAILEVLRDSASRSGHLDSPLLSALPAADDPTASIQTLRSIGSRITAVIEVRQCPEPVEAELRVDTRRKRRSFLSALGVVFLGLVIAYSLRRYVEGFTSAAPTPPQAPRAAMVP